VLHRRNIRSITAERLLAASFLMIGQSVAGTKVSAQASRQDRLPDSRDTFNPCRMPRGMWVPKSMSPHMQQRMKRFWTFMHQGVPLEHQDGQNPAAFYGTIIRSGRRLYHENRASCDGSSGMGDGEAVKSPNPSPTLLAYMNQMHMIVGDYMLWAISESGVVFGAGIRGGNDVVSIEVIWTIVGVMPARFPSE